MADWLDRQIIKLGSCSNAFFNLKNKYIQINFTYIQNKGN